MFVQEFEQFNQGILQDQTLQAKLTQVTSREAFVSMAVELGHERGFNFTTKEIENEITRQEREEKNKAEWWISDEQLEAVSGANVEASQKTSPTVPLSGCCRCCDG